MREKETRFDQSFRRDSSFHDRSYVQGSHSMYEADNHSSSRLSDYSQNRGGGRQHDADRVDFQTPNRVGQVHFETEQDEAGSQGTHLSRGDGAGEAAMIATLSAKSDAERVESSEEKSSTKPHKLLTAKTPKADPDADWFGSQPESDATPETDGKNGDMLAQIAGVERGTDGADGPPAGLMAQMDKVEQASNDSAYDSFHSEEAQDDAEPPESAPQRQSTLAVSQKAYMQRGLSVIREDRADSVMTQSEMHDDYEGRMERSDSPMSSCSDTSRDTERSVHEEPQMTELSIRQKVQGASTPNSRARVIAELKVDLAILSSEINVLRNSQDPESEALLQEKYRLRDVLETSIRQLEEKDAQR